jgi:carbohydrate-selective porin OprB
MIQENRAHVYGEESSMKKPVVCLAVGLTMIGLALVSAAVVWAQPSLDADRQTTLRARVDRLAEQLGNLELALGLTGIVQGSMNNDDNNPDKGDTTDANWSVDFEIGAPIGNHGRAFILIEAGQGDGLTDEAGIADSFFGVNDDAGGSEARLEVTEAWYEHTLWDGRVVFTLGKIDLSNYFDANALANDEATQFLATGLVNSIVLAFPDDNGPGVRLTISPTS